MKKIILGAILLFSMTLFSQTTIIHNGDIHLSDNSDVTNDFLNAVSANCSNGYSNNDLYIINGNLYLEGQILEIKGVNLTVNGSIINNGGSISNDCPHGDSALVCIYNNCLLIGEYVVLSTPEFNFSKDYGYKYKAYDLTGRILQEGVTDANTFNILPKNQLLILSVESFKEIKIYNK